MRKWMTKKNIHIGLIVLGMIFTIIPLFHSNLWFDESYSVALSSHSFVEIWTIDMHDVHPVFYYDCLHVLYLIFGSNIFVYRLFSWVCLSIMGIFGYFGIRKDYGEDVGLWFTFFVFFFPINVVYAGEIRMYMLVGLLVLLGTFYAMRIGRGDQRIHNHVLMVLFFVLAAYTHYYGLLAAAIVNIILLIVLIKQYKTTTKKDVGFWFLDAFFQIGLYLPWIFVFIGQTSNVKENFWIQWSFPKSLLEMIQFQFAGNLGSEEFVLPMITYIIEAVIVIYMIYVSYIRRHELGKPVIFTLGTYVGVILVAYCAGKYMNRVILYARYLLVCTPLLLLFFSFLFEKAKKPLLNNLFVVAIILCSIGANTSLVRSNYDSSNDSPYTYLNEHMQKDDIILVSNYLQDPNSFITVAKYQDHPLIYWNENMWMDESVSAYRAYRTDMTVVYNLKDVPKFSGRVWVVYADDDAHNEPVTHVYDAVIEQFSGKGEGVQYFQTAYKSIEYTIGLVTVE